MDIRKNWIEIRKHFNKCFRTNFHVSLASVDKEGNPTVTPIGSLFLNNNQTGFYFEKFPTKLPENSKDHKNICVLAVNSSTFFWLFVTTGIGTMFLYSDRDVHLSIMSSLSWGLTGPKGGSQGHFGRCQRSIPPGTIETNFYFFSATFFFRIIVLFVLCLEWSSLSSVLLTSHSAPPHQILGECSPYPHLPSCTIHCPICDPNPLQNLRNTRDFFFFCFVSGTALLYLGFLQPHRTRANVWQVPHQPPSPPALHFLSDLLLLPSQEVANW